MKATWANTIIAESADTVVVEGNHYFPADSVNMDLLRPSDTQSHCPWKGDANYCDIVVADEVNQDAVWFYPDPKPAAKEIHNHYAFWRGVTISE